MYVLTESPERPFVPVTWRQPDAGFLCGWCICDEAERLQGLYVILARPHCLLHRKRTGTNQKDAWRRKHCLLLLRLLLHLQE